jgi:3-oxoacyl-(acyl-carrier-protein) synthase III
MPTGEFVAAIPMPFTGESIVDGILVSWLVEPGDTVTRGQHVAELETEKSVWEFESPCDGVIEALSVEPGDVVDVNSPIFEIRTVDEDVRHLAVAGEAAPAEVDDEAEEAVLDEKGIRIAPRIKKMLREAGVAVTEWLEIAKRNGGRIQADQVESYLAGLKRQKSMAVSEKRKKTECYIAAIGTYTPKKIVGNDHFVEHFDDIDESYIEKVTGIRERRWVESESTSDMAIEASKRALENSGIEADEIEMVILATTTADMPLPASACLVASKLGCDGVPAFDVQAACSGWLYALSIGREYVLGGRYRKVLVVAAETMSAFTDITDRATGFLFGDGAGAAILSTDSSGHRLSEVVMKTDTNGYDIIYRKAGGTVMPLRNMSSPRDEFWVMDGGRMFRSAVTGFSNAITDVIVQEKAKLGDIAWFVPHQANQRILKTVAHRLKAEQNKFFSNIHRMGNTSAASIPLALIDLQAQHQLNKGDKVLLCAVGAGLTSASCIIEW